MICWRSWTQILKSKAIRKGLRWWRRRYLKLGYRWGGRRIWTWKWRRGNFRWRRWRRSFRSWRFRRTSNRKSNKRSFSRKEKKTRFNRSTLNSQFRSQQWKLEWIWRWCKSSRIPHRRNAEHILKIKMRMNGWFICFLRWKTAVKTRHWKVEMRLKEQR